MSVLEVEIVPFSLQILLATASRKRREPMSGRDGRDCMSRFISWQAWNSCRHGHTVWNVRLGCSTHQPPSPYAVLLLEFKEPVAVDVR